MTSFSVARRVVRTTAGLAVAFLVLADVHIGAESPVPADSPPSAVFLVATSAAAATHVPDLQRYFRETLRLDLQELPIITPGPSTWNADRRQRSAEALIQQLIEREETRLRTGRIVVIAITDQDLWAGQGQNEWMFGKWSAARVAVVSYARMDPQWFGLEADAALLASRLQRVVARYIGKLYFELPWSSDSTSLLYNDLRSIDGIDRLSNDLAADGFFSARPLVDNRYPVYEATGEYRHSELDFRIEDTPSINFERIYRSNGELAGPFGVRTSHSYGASLVGDAASAAVTLEFENGWTASYRRITGGTGEQDAAFVHDDKPSRFVNSRLSWKRDGWQLELTDGTSYRFSACSQTSPKRCSMSAYTDREGHETLVRFDAHGDIATIEGEHHHTLDFHRDTHHRIVLAWDDAGNWMTYQYDGGGRLTKSLSSFEEESGYAYDADGRLIGVRVGSLEERIHYDAHGRCIRLERRRLDYVDAAGHPFEHRDVLDFAYTLDESGAHVRQTVVTGADEARVMTFNANGYVLTDTYAPDSGHAQRTTIDRDPATNAAHAVSVACRVNGREAASTTEIRTGQSESALIARARRACDVKAMRAAAANH